MDKFELTVQERSVTGRKVKVLREQGLVPAVIYGGGEPAIHISVDGRSLDHLLARGGASHLIEMTGAGLQADRVLVREVQREPVRRSLYHADFVRVVKGERIRMGVPLMAVGHAPAVSDGAILLQAADTVEIECLPDDLPAHIEVDLSVLKTMHDTITAADLTLPQGVILATDYLEELLFSVTMPRAATAEEEAEEEFDIGAALQQEMGDDED